MRQTLVLAIALLMACDRPRREPPPPPISVYAAASLAKPLATVADSFRASSGIVMHTELGGSMEHARKITELGRVPDAIVLVDDEVIASLMPAHIDWYVRFATNRLVIAYGPKSRLADSITSDNWWRILTRPGVTIGRADPAVAPVGKHALALLKRTGSYYKSAAVSERLAEHAPLKFVRPNAAELAALLETGEVDYIIDYASVARQYGFRFVSLPEDLATPVLYGVSVPRGAAHFSEGVKFAAFLLSDAGKSILRDAYIDVMSMPVAVGSAVPPEISPIVRTASGTPVLAP